jgi:hypothetical protein
MILAPGEKVEVDEIVEAKKNDVPVEYVIYPDGRSFYAMRFVKGDSLKAAIESFYSLDNPNRKDPGAIIHFLRN